MQTRKGNSLAGSPAYRVVSISLLTAVTAVFTLLVRVPIAPTRGYINLGDVAIFFTAFTFGPVTALISGGLGTAIADLLAGYAQWAPITLVIHGLQGLVAGFIVKQSMIVRSVDRTALQDDFEKHAAADDMSEAENPSKADDDAGTDSGKKSRQRVVGKLSVLAVVLSGIAGTIIMVGLYFLAAGVMYGFGPAAVEIIGNVIQCVVGTVGGFVLAKTVVKAYPPVRDFFL